ncbi:MAG TPA: hypothetical protein VFH78_12490 [Candidatus Thermoplasmatota archaeon]|nr:hypothetical protein [Candidatus Thermoplasmatota archaeon]
MRPLPTLLALALVAGPFASPTQALPNEIYVGVDPISGSASGTMPYDPAVATGCRGTTTMQVQRNANNGWDVVLRRAAAVPTTDAVNYPVATVANSAVRCPLESNTVYTFTNVGGSPSQGLSKASGNACQGWSLSVTPFTLGGTARFEYHAYYEPSACGSSGPRGYYVLTGHPSPMV